MKRLLSSIAVCAALTGPAHAYDTIERCAILGDYAETIMKGRQQEMPMSQVMGIVKTNSLGIFLVQQAYKAPSYEVPENQDDAIAEFRNEIEAWCFSENASMMID